MHLFRSLMTRLVVCSFALSACTTPGNMAGGIGPRFSSVVDQEERKPVDENRPRLDIVIPVFDPGISNEDEKNYHRIAQKNWRDEDNKPVAADEYVWPELRRAEAVRFAWQLKNALEATGAFGAIRVTPDAMATGDLYLLGRIEESDGDQVVIKMEALDIGDNKWFHKKFDHEVAEDFYDNLRNEGKDPYEPVFREIAEYLVKKMRSHDNTELETMRKITELRFGAQFAEGAFADNLVRKRGTYTLATFPNEEDAMLKRTRAVRVRDQLFVDGMQKNYNNFSEKMEDSYLIWQQNSAFEVRANRKARRKARGQAVLGGLALVLGGAALAAGYKTSSSYGADAAITGAVAAGLAGAYLLKESFQTSAEAKVHREALKEVGNSIDMELAPQVIKFEEETVELQGTASQQFTQWRAFLQKIYDREKIPDVQL